MRARFCAASFSSVEIKAPDAVSNPLFPGEDTSGTPHGADKTDGIGAQEHAPNAPCANEFESQ